MDSKGGSKDVDLTLVRSREPSDSELHVQGFTWFITAARKDCPSNRTCASNLPAQMQIGERSSSQRTSIVSVHKINKR